MNTGMGICVLAALAGVFFLQRVSGYSSGAPIGACQEMTPLHGFQPQTSTPPYSISVDRSSYAISGTVSVTISGCGSQIFKGFALQARQVDVNSDRNSPVGFFSTPIGTRAMSGCGISGQSVTHQNSNAKQSITFQWTAPETSEGDVVFVATFVESHSTFWVKINSNVIQDETKTTKSNVGSVVYPSPFTCQPTLPPPPPQTQTPATQPQPERPTQSRTLQPTLPTQTQPPATQPQPERLTQSRTLPPTLPTETQPPATQPQAERPNPQFPSSPTQTIVSLTTPTMEKEKENKQFASFTAPTSARPVCSESNLTSELQGSASQTPECGESKWCYRWCPAGQCIFNLTTQYTGSEIAIELSSKITSTRPQWIAVGFSHDTKMGDDSVVECVLAGDGRVSAYTSFNDGIENIRIGKEGIQSSSGGITDGTMNCLVNRLLAVDTEPRIFNLENNTEWYIFLASGETDGTVKYQHLEIPHISEKKVNIQKPQLTLDEREETDSRRSAMIRAHASLMLVAWIFTTSLGIIVARYYKLLGGSVTCCNDRYSFHMHRVCMAVTFICVSISFIVIFVEVGGYSRISPIEGLLVQAHPILGIVVTALVVLNFSMGLLRPAPGRSVRPLYNWAHWVTGTIAWIAAIMTIFLGFAIERVKAHPVAKYVLVGFVVLHLLVQITLEWLSCHGVNTQMDKPYPPPPDNYEMTTMDSQNSHQSGILEIQKDTVGGVGKLKAGILVLYTFALAFILLALLILINKTFEDQHKNASPDNVC